MNFAQKFAAIILLIAPVASLRAQTVPVPADVLPWHKQATQALEAANAAEASAVEARAAADAAKAAAADAKAAAAAAKPAVTTAPAPETGSISGPVPTAAVESAVLPSSTQDDPSQTPAAVTESEPQKDAKGRPLLPPAKKLFGAVKVPADLKPRAIGSYAKGCLAGAKPLAVDGPAWQAMRLSRNRNWGHPQLITLLERFASEMKTKENWPGLLIGDIAQPRGGPMLTGHKSHQLGLDADIWYKPMPSTTIPVAERETYEPLLLASDDGTEVIAASWNDGYARLVKRAASYPEVERIFVHPAIKKKFCEVAGTDRGWLAKVRPMWLHNYHFHVRIGCPAGSTSCEKQKPTTGDEGCGKELDDWFKLLTRPPPKPRPPEAKPATPPKPKPEITLAQLPAECRVVLESGQAKPSVAVPAPVPAKKPAVKTAAKSRSAESKIKTEKK